jgi:hypothetical protein
MKIVLIRMREKEKNVNMKAMTLSLWDIQREIEREIDRLMQLLQ